MARDDDLWRFVEMFHLDSDSVRKAIFQEFKDTTLFPNVLPTCLSNFPVVNILTIRAPYYVDPAAYLFL